jgi:YHS domain-containing protein
MKIQHLGPALAASALLFLASITSHAADQTVAKPKPYPLDKCLVSDEKLGSMGKPYVIVHEGQEIKLCCKACEKGFKKEPAKYLKKLEAEQKKKAK